MGSLLHLRHYGSQQVDHRIPGRGLGNRHIPKQHQTTVIHTVPSRAILARVGDTQLEGTTQDLLGKTGSHYLIY